MTRQLRQQELPGTEEPDAPVPPPELLEGLDELLGQEENHRADGVRVRELKENLLAATLKAGFERLPYVDAKTGKRKYWIADRTARAKKMSAAGSDGKAKRARDRDPEVGEAVERADPAIVFGGDDKVESRRVKRTAAHDKVVDPFASTRSAMESE